MTKLNIEIQVEGDLALDIDLDFTPGQEMTYDEPGFGPSYDIESIHIRRNGEPGSAINVTEFMQDNGFIDSYDEVIINKCVEAM